MTAQQLAMAPYAAMLACLAAMLAIMLGQGRKTRITRRAPSRRDVDLFLCRMAFMSATDYDPIKYFQVDVLQIEFLDGFDQQTQYGFFRYSQELDMAQLQAVMKLLLWLIQHDVAYRLTFRWNARLPIRYNLSRIGLAKKMRESIARCPVGEIKAYDLKADSHALRRQWPE